jgi:ribA/ribD-fused uncharacterized protein
MQEQGQGALHFYGHKPNTQYNFFSQHFIGPFSAPSPATFLPASAFPTSTFPASTSPPDGNESAMEFNCTEQYMMYAKALLFSDPATATRIMGASAPLEQKKLGRKVAGFDDEVWCARRERIVEEGNW